MLSGKLNRRLKMRKVSMLLGLFGILLMACGGAGAGNPEAAVTAFFDAVKAGDAAKASEYVVGGIPEEERAIFEQLAPMMEAMELSVTGSTIAEDGQTAVVNISVTFMGESDTDEVACVLDGGVWKLEESSF
jgi:hypothetical protein